MPFVNTFTKSTADQPEEQMLLKIKKGEDCATEPESPRKGCNVAETVGNTKAVVGSAVTLASPFTRPAASAVALPGLGMSLGGTGVTVTSKITEHFSSSSKLKNVQKIDGDCKKTGPKIKEHSETLTSESESKDKRAMAESMNKGAIAQKQRAGQSGAVRVGDGPKKPEKEKESSEESSNSEEESSNSEEESSDSEEESSDSEEESSDSEDETGKKQRVLQMALLNVQSVRTNTFQLRRLIADENLDFLVLTESWLGPGQQGDDELRNLLPPDRSFIHKPRGSRGGGVAIVFSNEFQFTQIHLQRVRNFEYVAGVVQHESWDHPVVIISVYHKTSAKRKMLKYFLFKLKCLVVEVYKNYTHHVIVAGDFNIWIDRPGWQQDRFDNFLGKSGLEQFVNQPTHKKGHILDLVLGRFVTIQILSIQDDGISDHWTVYFKVRPLTK